jgi:hypothetical protein
MAFYELDAKAGDVYHLTMKEIPENNQTNDFSFDETIYNLVITMYEQNGKLYYKQEVENDPQTSVPTFYNYSKNVEVSLSKTFTDGTTNIPIEGASYQLYRKAANQEDYEALQEVQSTNEQGEIQWSGLEQNPDYSYYIKEISAPAGFELDDSYYELTQTKTENDAEEDASYFAWGDQIKKVIYTINLTNKMETTSLSLNKELINYNTDEEIPLTFQLEINQSTSQILQSQSANKEQWINYLNSLLPQIEAENAQAKLIKINENTYQIETKSSKDFTIQINNLPIQTTVTINELANGKQAEENEIYKTTVNGKELAYTITSPSQEITLDKKENEITIQNEFIENKTTIDIEGTKYLDGKRSEIPFNFIMEIKEDDAWKELQRVQNDKDGTFIFKNIEFDQEGNYILRIKELEKEGYTQDSAVYEIEVVAANNPETKQLEANIETITKIETDENGDEKHTIAEAISFNNRTINEEESPKEEKDKPKEEGEVPTAASSDQMMWLSVLVGGCCVIGLCAGKMKKLF